MPGVLGALVEGYLQGQEVQRKKALDAAQKIADQHEQIWREQQNQQAHEDRMATLAETAQRNKTYAANEKSLEQEREEREKIAAQKIEEGKARRALTLKIAGMKISAAEKLALYKAGSEAFETALKGNALPEDATLLAGIAIESVQQNGQGAPQAAPQQFTPGIVPPAPQQAPQQQSTNPMHQLIQQHLMQGGLGQQPQQPGQAPQQAPMQQGGLQQQHPHPLLPLLQAKQDNEESQKAARDAARVRNDALAKSQIGLRASQKRLTDAKARKAEIDADFEKALKEGDIAKLAATVTEIQHQAKLTLEKIKALKVDEGLHQSERIYKDAQTKKLQELPEDDITEIQKNTQVASKAMAEADVHLAQWNSKIRVAQFNIDNPPTDMPDPDNPGHTKQATPVYKANMVKTYQNTILGLTPAQKSLEEASRAAHSAFEIQREIERKFHIKEITNESGHLPSNRSTTSSRGGVVPNKVNLPPGTLRPGDSPTAGELATGQRVAVKPLAKKKPVQKPLHERTSAELWDGLRK
jgi:hypothetical protein